MKTFRQNIKIIAWLFLISSSTWGALQTDDWVVRLAASPGARSAVEPLRFHLPDDMPQSVRAALIYELDGVDITKTVTVASDNTVVLSQEPLAPGVHRLRLVHAPSSGRWRELGVWGFTVSETHNELVQSTTDHPTALSTPLGRKAELAVKFAQPVSTHSVPADEALLANPATTQDERSQAVQKAEDITAVLSSGSIAVQLGQQKLAYKSLIHQDRKRNGTVGNWSLGHAGRLLAFGMRTPDQAQLNGVVAQHSWPTSGQDRFSLVGGWISTDTGTVEAAHKPDGNAWSLAGDATLLERRLRVHLEYAGSHSAAGAGDELSGDGGMTYRLQAELHSHDQSNLRWLVGVEHKRVAPTFFSLANPSQANDRLMLRTYGNLAMDTWRLDWSLERWRNNLNQDDDVPSLQAHKGRIAASWAPTEAFGLGFLGKPTYELAADYRHLRELAAPTVPDHIPRDRRTLGLKFQTQFTGNGWFWGIKARSGRTYHVVDSTAAARSYAFGLYGDFPTLGRVSAKPVLSWRREHKPASRVADETWLAKLASPNVELRKGLRAGLAIEHKRRMQSNHAGDTRATRLGGRMVWTLRRPNTYRSGLSLTLAGSYSDAKVLAKSASATDGYGLMLSLSSAHPFEEW